MFSSIRILPRRVSFLSAVIIALLLPGCSSKPNHVSYCESCHRGIEHVSASHGSCVSCHGGNEVAKNKRQAHAGMYGSGNPSNPAYWEKTCGACHAYQLGRLKSDLMYTNTGMIRNIQLTWEGSDGHLYATKGGEVFDGKGSPGLLRNVADLDNLSGELYRKFCSLCHVGIETNDVYSASHAAGCAACHFPYNNTATYEGRDPTVFGKSPYSETHALEPLPGDKVCFRCHNRSGRIALSYDGLYDGNNSMVPTRNGLPGPVMISGPRNASHIVPDVHAAAGMECIDCHTSRDIMGDGYAYENMYLQTEIQLRRLPWRSRFAAPLQGNNQGE